MTVHALDHAMPLPVVAPRRRERPTHLRVVGDDERLVRPQLPVQVVRLTRALLAFGVVSLLVLLVWARATAPEVPAEHAITVEPGQTLSQIAVEELPAIPVDIAVMRIQIANDMKDSDLIAGQELLIPGAG